MGGDVSNLGRVFAESFERGYQRGRAARPSRLSQALVALVFWLSAVSLSWWVGGWRLGLAAILGTFAFNLSEDLRR